MPFSVDTLLGYMRVHGQSVNLGWGEDTDQWECSWISGGRRYTGFGPTAQKAAQAAVDAAPLDRTVFVAWDDDLPPASGEERA